MTPFERLLRDGLDNLGLDAERLAPPLLAYAVLIRKWNRVVNLTALTGDAELAGPYLLDSLTAVPYLQGPSVLDVGTGGGTPGLPLALARPDLEFVLLDSRARKTRFVQQAVIELGLVNVQVVTGRVEEFSFPGGFSTIVSRAFASVGDFVAITRHLGTAGGIWLALKGPAVDDGELERLPQGLQAESLPVIVPGVAAPRQIVRIR